MFRYSQYQGTTEVRSSFVSENSQFSRFVKDFEIGRLLGTGAFGHVYKAVGKAGPYEGRVVAIKMINKSKLTEDLRRRVVNEVEIQWQLQHPSILELYDYSEDEDTVYLVMEICTGGELYRYLKERKRPLTESEARCVMRQLVDGLLYMHSNGIMHRDLKLSNILLTDEYHIKIGDFGLATKVNGREGEQKTMCGTPNYISPEIISRQPYGFASDIWSLGCILFTFLAGKPPFESQKVRSTLDKVTRGDYTLPTGLSTEAQDLIRRLLQIQPRHRIPLGQILLHPFLNPSLPTQSLQRLTAPGIKPTGSSPLASPANYLEARVPQASAKTEEAYTRYTKGKYQFQMEHAWKAYAQQCTEEKSPPKTSTLQPINTERLKPIKQKTKHGTIELLSSGTIILDLDGEKTIMAISKSGEQVG
ncbi:Pkinase-domain-containing protein [Basidiobolus meristosporus CBS 931.73]|uniref:Pkinase-domain-containing protein n=1 Tax=Basidiobolus meristosporus CBS 931.73 TaxID=1314790 RepID=A0A1Y1Z227_9FUNG|nr:Pkinase-domain-containing protein [Basidiobolus meristosporus CBS 931.73]|eukprot:ORY04226.1 Pkinase-domain-containing protein [Basidiobolus meristosporus CBS 931.73]